MQSEECGDQEGERTGEVRASHPCGRPDPGPSRHPASPRVQLFALSWIVWVILLPFLLQLVSFRVSGPWQPRVPILQMSRLRL